MGALHLEQSCQYLLRLYLTIRGRYSGLAEDATVGVAVGVLVGVDVAVGVLVGVGVAVGVLVGVLVGVSVAVGVLSEPVKFFPVASGGTVTG
jgi:hypothetical protein